MITNYYNASNNFSAPIRREPKPFRPQESECEQQQQLPKEQIGKAKTVQHTKGFLDCLNQDSALIISLAVLLLLSECDDMLLFIVLAYLLMF